MRIVKPSAWLNEVEQDGTEYPDLVIFDRELDKEPELQPVLVVKGRKPAPDNAQSTQGGKQYSKQGGKWRKQPDAIDIQNRKKKKLFTIPKV